MTLLWTRLRRGAFCLVECGGVSNVTTGNLLEGARVELPALGRSAFVDRTGRYVLGGVPAGTHEIVASYSGLDPLKFTVTLAAGQRATRDFDLTSGIYGLDAFTAYLKSGLDVREQTVNLERRNRRWSYIGRDALPADPSILLWDKVKTGRNIPVWEGAQFIQNGQRANPALRQEDKYYYSNQYSASSSTSPISSTSPRNITAVFRISWSNS